MTRWWTATVCVAVALGTTTPARSQSAARQVQFAVRTLSGDTLRIGPGQPATFVALFATWCRSCKDEVATLNQLQREFASQKIRVIAVNVDKPLPETVRHWLDGLGATYPAALDVSGDIGRAFGAVGVPEFYLVSADGRVVFARRGPVTSAMAALRKVVAQLGTGTP